MDSREITSAIISLGGESTAVTETLSEIDPRSVEFWTEGFVVGNRYTVVDELAIGGMSLVFRARDSATGNHLALKAMRLPDELSRKQYVSWVQTFRRGAASLAPLQHPNIARCHDFGVHGSVPFVALELVEGTPLSELLDKQGALSFEVTLDIARQLADALEYSHAAGVVHRDVKPSNVMYDGHTVKLIDFGVAFVTMDHHIAWEEFGLTAQEGRAAGTAGTPHYMPPETLRDGSQDARVDVWSFGVTLFELLSGQRAFRTREDVLLGRRAPMWKLPSDLPAWFGRLLQRCIAQVPDERPQTFAEIADTLRRRGDLENRPSASLTRQLPTESADFFVETPALDIVDSAIESGVRAICLTGPGGVGKTRAITEWLYRLSENAPYRANFVSLEDTHDMANLLREVAFVLDLPRSAVRLQESIAWSLAQSGEHVLVLDGCDRISELVAELVDDLTTHAPDLQVVMTCRERVPLPSAQFVEVSPLSTDRFEQDPSPAARLYLARANDAVGGWHGDGELDDVEALVRELDGLPLAIELAAARVALMPPSRFLKRLERRFALLRRNSDVEGSRHDGLRETLLYSWEALSEEEKVAMCQLARFDGRISQRAIDAFLFPSENGTALQLVEQLVSRSLLRREGEHYAHYRSIAHFARDQSARSQSDDWNRRTDLRFARLFARHGERTNLAALRRSRSAAHLEAELANLETARRLARRHQDVVSEVRIASALLVLYDLIGPYSPGLELANELDEVIGLVAPELQCELLFAMGAIFRRTGEFDRAKRAWRSAHHIATETANSLMVAELNLALGKIHDRLGDLDTAQEFLDDALEQSRRLDDQWIERDALGNLGNIAVDRAEYDEAERLYEEARRLSSALLDPVGFGVWLGNLGIVAYYRGDFETAAQRFQDALESARSTRDRSSEMLNLANIGDCRMLAGQVQSARACYKRSLEMSDELGDRFQSAVCRGKIGQLELAAGDPATAIALLEPACDQLAEIGNLYFACELSQTLGIAYAQTGRWDEATATFEAAENHAEALDSGEEQRVIRGWLGICEIERGVFDEAEEKLACGLAESKSLGRSEITVVFLCYMSRLALHRGRRDLAESKRDEAYELDAQLGNAFRVLPFARAALRSLDHAFDA